MGLPVSTGIIGEYSWDNATTTVMNNLVGGSNINLSGAAINEDEQCVYLSNTAFAYMPCSIGNNATLYFLAKVVQTTSMYGGTSWGFALCGADSSHRVFCGIDMFYQNIWRFFCLTGVNASKITDWGVLAITAENGSQKLYFNGELVAELTQAIDFGFSGLYVNTGAYNGATPTSTSGFGEDIYIKYMALANVVHTAEEVKQNSFVIEQKYFGEAVTDDTAKARAAVLGYMLGYNNVSAESLEELLKTYREGLLNGDNGKGEVVEEYTSTDTILDFDIDNDGNSTNLAAVDTSKGFYRVYIDDDENITGYIKVYIEPYYHRSEGSASYAIMQDKIMAASYDANGVLTGTKELEYRWSYSSASNVTTVATRVRIYPSGRFEVDCDNTNDYTGENYTQTTIGMLGLVVNGNYSYTTNVSPI